MALKRGIEVAVEKVVAKIAKIAKKIDLKNSKEVEQVAAIAANSDSIIGKKIAEAFEAVGKMVLLRLKNPRPLTQNLKLSKVCNSIRVIYLHTSQPIWKR